MGKACRLDDSAGGDHPVGWKGNTADYLNLNLPAPRTTCDLQAVRSQEVLSLLFHSIWRVDITKFLTSCRFWVSPSTPSLQFDSWVPRGVHVQLSGHKKKQEQWPSYQKKLVTGLQRGYMCTGICIIWPRLEVRGKGFIHISVLFKFGVEHCYI